MTRPPEQTPEIRAVLDRSALQSYARGHVHVGELLIDIADEKASIAIPAAALADAHAAALENEHARALLRLLTTLPGTAVLKLDAEAASSIAGTFVVTNGDMARAHAVWAANKHNALYLTTEPDEVKFLVPADNVHPIPTEDA